MKVTINKFKNKFVLTTILSSFMQVLSHKLTVAIFVVLENWPLRDLDELDINKTSCSQNPPRVIMF